MLSDRYNRRWVNIFRYICKKQGNFAITIKQTTYYNCPWTEVSKNYRAHQNKYKELWNRDGCLFIIKFLYYSIFYNKCNPPYEKEAINEENEYEI